MTNVRYVSKENSAIFFETPLNFESAGFTSKPLDKETGLYNFPQRYYDSRNVKWLTLDPMGPMLMNPMEQNKDGQMIPKQSYSQVEGLNWYNYCSNNPVMYHDPEGTKKYTATVVVGTTTDGEDVGYAARTDNADGQEKLDIISENMEKLGWDVNKYEVSVDTGFFGRKKNNITGFTDVTPGKGDGELIEGSDLADILRDGVAEGVGGKISALNKVYNTLTFGHSFGKYMKKMGDAHDGTPQLRVALTIEGGYLQLNEYGLFCAMDTGNKQGTLAFAKDAAFFMTFRDQDVCREIFAGPTLRILKKAMLFTY